MSNKKSSKRGSSSRSRSPSSETSSTSSEGASAEAASTHAAEAAPALEDASGEDAAFDDPRSLDLCAVGLGQGGGNLAAEWRRRGYRTVVFNTARADLQGLARQPDLEVPELFRHYIGLEGTDGAGRDPEYGRACVHAHAERIREIVTEHLGGADALLLCAGLGGGTGSSCDALIAALEPLEIPIVTVTTLPADSESGITKVNAVKSANAIVSAPLSGRVFIDNERLQENFPELDVINYYPTVNARVLGPLDELNRLNASGKLWSIRTFDGEDLRKVLLSSGVLQTHIEKIASDKALTEQQIFDVVERCATGGKHGATGLAMKDCAYLALVIVGPESVLKETPARVIDGAIAKVKAETGGAAVYEGMYIGPEDTPLKAYVLTASLALPNRVEALLEQARHEGGDLAKKIREDIKQLEISPLDGLDLFRAPSRKSSVGPRAPAPKPRPLSAQLESELPQAPVVESPTPSADVVEDPEPEPAYDPDMARIDAGPDAGLAASARAALESRPRVGTGRYDEDAEVEKTHYVPDAAIEAPPRAGTTEFREPATRSKKTRKKEPAVKPRVGTGRHDDAEPMEATAMVDPSSDGDKDDPRRSFAASDHGPRVGTGAWRQGEPVGGIEATHLVDPDRERPPERPPMVELPTPPGSEGGLLGEEFDLANDDPDGDATEKRPVSELLGREKSERMFRAEGSVEGGDDSEAPGFELGAVQTHAIDEFDIIAEVPERKKKPREGDRTTADHRLDDDDAIVSSMLDPSSPGLQGVYEDLIDRFRQARDKRGRDRIARRLVDDAKSNDVEVRALAVWAMVKLEENVFGRGLKRAAKDENPEIQKLAQSGLVRLQSKEVL